MQFQWATLLLCRVQVVCLLRLGSLSLVVVATCAREVLVLSPLSHLCLQLFLGSVSFLYAMAAPSWTGSDVELVGSHALNTDVEVVSSSEAWELVNSKSEKEGDVKEEVNSLADNLQGVSALEEPDFTTPEDANDPPPTTDAPPTTAAATDPPPGTDTTTPPANDTTTPPATDTTTPPSH